MKKIIVCLFVISLGFLLKGCSPTEPPDPPPPPPPVVEKPILTLELDDAHCTEAWIELKTTNLQLPSTILLKEFNPTGDSISKVLILNTKDSLLYIDTLLPNQTYRYQVSGIWNPKPDSQQIVTSNKLTVTTMDTTSHNFTFEMITFGGEIGSSVLFDVAIINENNIIAVGDIWIKDDTSSLGYTKYNAVHWDGINWELKTILYGGFTVPITSIWAFSENDIWFGVGYLIHWNGIAFREVIIPNWNTRINGIWGRSSNDLYVVGYSGNITHFNGTSWKRIESGTTLNINDIWGDYNLKTKEWEILAVGGNVLAGNANVLLKIIQSNLAEKMNTDSVEWPLRSLLFISNRIYYIGGSGIYQKHLMKENQWKNDMFSITTYSTNRIRGNEINNIVAAGGAGELLHFNGTNWKSFIEVTGIPGNYYGASIYANTIVAVGQGGRQAIITIGRR